jgi:hypothetical protein
MNLFEKEDIEALYERLHHQEVLSPKTKSAVLMMLNSSLED